MSDTKSTMIHEKKGLLKSLINLLRRLWRFLKDRLLPTVVKFTGDKSC
jgi:hypothetical protein